MKNKLIAGIAMSAVLIGALTATPAQSRDRNSWIAPLVGGMIIGSIMNDSARYQEQQRQYQAQQRYQAQRQYQEQQQYQEQRQYQEQQRYQRYQEPQRPYDLPPTRIPHGQINAPLYPAYDEQPVPGTMPETYLPVTICRREWADNYAYQFQRCSKQHMNQRYITCNGNDNDNGGCWQQ
jgi:transcription initiation factor TFIID subunit TAF12